MDKKIRLVLISLLIFISTGAFANQGPTYLIPIKGEINRGSFGFVKNETEKAIKNQAGGIIYEIDTYGGYIDSAIDIKDYIISQDIKTVSYVNNKAESAGVLLAIAGEERAMGPRGTIGSAEPIPNTEKVLSMWRTILKDTANYRGIDGRIIEGMADKDIVIKGISKRGKLINLTSEEALELGLINYIADDPIALVQDLGLSSDIVEVDESFAVKLSRYISNPYFSSLLLSLGLVGLIIEIFTPGFGFGGSISIIGFGLFFGGNIMAGNGELTSLVLFIIGLILLVIEGIVPGFGLPGIAGISLIGLGIVLAMDSLSLALYSMSLAIIVASIFTVVLVKLGYKSKALNKIILKEEIGSEGGFISSPKLDQLLGKEGKSLTELRPGGFIDIDGSKYDGISEEAFIEAGKDIKVVRVEGSKIYVRRK